MRIEVTWYMLRGSGTMLLHKGSCGISIQWPVFERMRLVCLLYHMRSQMRDLCRGTNLQGVERRPDDPEYEDGTLNGSSIWRSGQTKKMSRLACYDWNRKDDSTTMNEQSLVPRKEKETIEGTAQWNQLRTLHKWLRCVWLSFPTTSVLSNHRKIVKLQSINKARNKRKMSCYSSCETVCV